MGWWPCEACGADCDTCSGTTPTSLSVELPSASNTVDCSDCADVAGTYATSFVTDLNSSEFGGLCQWTFGSKTDTGSTCGDVIFLQVLFAGGAGTSAYINVQVWIEGPTGTTKASGDVWVGTGLPLGASVNATVSPALPTLGKWDCAATITLTLTADVDLETSVPDVYCTIPSGAEITISS